LFRGVGNTTPAASSSASWRAFQCAERFGEYAGYGHSADASWKRPHNLAGVAVLEVNIDVQSDLAVLIQSDGGAEDALEGHQILCDLRLNRDYFLDPRMAHGQRGLRELTGRGCGGQG
jgi:hypothetical protein